MRIWLTAFSISVSFLLISCGQCEISEYYDHKKEVKKTEICGDRKDGKLINGVERGYLYEGSVNYETEYKDGVMNGKWVRFHPVVLSLEKACMPTISKKDSLSSITPNGTKSLEVNIPPRSA